MSKEIREQIDKIKNFGQFLNENTEIKNKLNDFLIDGRYLYHYTLTDNLDSIMDDGLIPKKYSNSYYKDGAIGIFLTRFDSLYKANLPQPLMDEMDEYYENEELYDTKPIVRLWVDVNELDVNKIIWDDDHILNKYGWNKAISNTDKIIESLDIWGSIAYLGTISKSAIIKYDFEYFN